MIDWFTLLVGVLLISALAVLAVRLRALDSIGAFSGAIVSLVALLAGGFAWLVMIIIFVAVSSAMTRYKYEYKRRLGSAQEKMGVRSWPNSLANGGVSVIASVAEVYTHSEIFAVMFLASVTAAMADTLATEVGLLSRSRPKLIIHPSRDVAVGTSGGTSVEGDLAAVITSVLMALVGVAILVVKVSGPVDEVLVSLSVAGGSIAGVFFDSLLGATVQGVYRCAACDTITENEFHHGRRGEVVRGLRHFDNNVVNFVGILFGSGVAILLFVLLVK